MSQARTLPIAVPVDDLCVLDQWGLKLESHLKLHGQGISTITLRSNDGITLPMSDLTVFRGPRLGKSSKG